jgi:hypothetical protein
MMSNRQILMAVAALVMLVTVPPILTSVHACGRQTYYTLTISTTAGGTTCPEPGTHTYENGTIATVKAIPCSSYKFGYWIVDDLTNNTANPIAITMNENHTIEAVFIAQTFTLTIIANIGGTTNPTPGNYSYPQGTHVTVTATPDEGYQLSIWLLDGSFAGSSNNITITMCSNHTIKAIFSKIVPEFPTIAPLAIFFIASLFIALLYKKAHISKKPKP